MSAQSGGGFNVRVIAAVIIAGIVGFIGYWVLSAFAPELGSGRDGGAHSLSTAATGYSGVVELLRASGQPVSIVRNPEQGAPKDGQTRFGGLLVLTPDPGTEPSDIIERLEKVEGPVLIILPKYQVQADPKHTGWVMQRGLLPAPEAMLAVGSWDTDLSTEVATFAGVNRSVSLWDEPAFQLVMHSDQLRSISGKGSSPLIQVDGRTVLAKLAGREDVFVLSDPDFVNNLAMKDAVHASSALALMRGIAGPGEPIAFDVTLNGLGAGSQSLLRLLFVPPFLGLTLCLIIAMLLALWQGFVRFGPAWREERNVAFGKAGLVANSARLIVQARRITNFASRYGAMVRESAARRLHAPTGLTGHALDQWLDRFADRQGQRFTTLLHALESAGNPVDIVRRAAALGQWRKDVLSESD